MPKRPEQPEQAIVLGHDAKMTEKRAVLGPVHNDDLIDDLVEVAMEVLHHDEQDGDIEAAYERRVLRTKITETIWRHSVNTGP